MNTLKIKIPDGYQIESFNEQTGEVRFQKISIDVRERIKTLADALKELGMDQEEFHRDLGMYTEPDEAAYAKLKKIIEALNEGWIPDWTNSSQYKYFPWFKMGGSSGSGFSYGDCAGWPAASACGSRLCFKSRELAEYAGKQFEDLYKEFLTL